MRRLVNGVGENAVRTCNRDRAERDDCNNQADRSDTPDPTAVNWNIGPKDLRRAAHRRRNASICADRSRNVTLRSARLADNAIRRFRFLPMLRGSPTRSVPSYALGIATQAPPAAWMRLHNCSATARVGAGRRTW